LIGGDVPVYEFLCRNCGLKFEKILPMGKNKAHECECGAEAEGIPSAFGFAFSHKPVNGPVPQNTGVHGIDYNFDQVIGRDAAEKWKVVEERNKAKDQAARDAAKDGKLIEKRDQLVKTGEGYRPITEPERVRVNENRTIAHEVSKAISAKAKKTQQE